jgi:lipopolysaccharide heptosyltransferase II
MADDLCDRQGAWAGARNILCVRLDFIGDVLMTTPALRALKQGGRRHISLLTSQAGMNISALIPEIDEAIEFDAPWLKTKVDCGAPAVGAMVKGLRRRAFDAAVIFTVYSQNPLPAALLCYLVGIPLRLAHCRENPYHLLTDWIPDPEPAELVRHEVQRQLDLVAAVGCTTSDRGLSLRCSEEALSQVGVLLRNHGIGADWLVVHAGASAPSRRYPPLQFAKAARILARDFQVIWTGDAAERSLVGDIQAAMRAPSLNLAGMLSLEQLVACISLAPLLISNNTGPVHIAAAMGTPVVDLYALTNPQHTPWQVLSRVLSHDVPCKYCYKSVCPEGHQSCLSRVMPDQVVRAAYELINITQPRRHAHRLAGMRDPICEL